MNILTDEETKAIDPDGLTEGFASAIESAVLAKLAAQDVEPVATVVISTTGMFAGIKRNLVLHQNAPILFDGDTLYTQAQYLAAQQRTAEACAKVCDEQHDKALTSSAAHRADCCATRIRNGEWRNHK